MNTTHWSVVIEARDGDSEARRRSLAVLCETHWFPLYAYVRRKGYDAEEAKDLTQEFFSRFVEKGFLKDVSPDKGKFRNFLLASLNHFLSNEWHKQQAQKRGGGKTFLSIDVAEAEDRLSSVASSDRSPEAEYSRRWALSLLHRAYDRLRAENDSGRRAERFEAVHPYITTDQTRVPYAELEDSTGVSEAALKVSVHRLRKRYGQLIRDEIRQTVTDDADIETELRELLAALSGE